MKKFSISSENKILLLQIARKTLEQYLAGEKVQIPDYSASELTVYAGAFVTLTNNTKLRGCIGRFKSNQPLYKLVQEMAIAAATQDTRFKSVTYDELKAIHIEISVLTPLQKINSIDEIEIGTHGIYIQKDFYSGTLLPQVAVSNHWSKKQFLEYCSEYKAGIGKNGWKDAIIFTYEAIIFEE